MPRIAGNRSIEQTREHASLRSLSKCLQAVARRITGKGRLVIEAAHRLGASAIALSVEHSSAKKGETLEDTARTLNAMRPDALVIRHRENGAPAAVAEIMEAPVLNTPQSRRPFKRQAVATAWCRGAARRPARTDA